MAAGTRRPEATVCALGNGSACVCPCSKARTIGAVFGLNGDHPGPLGADPAELLHLVKRLPHADQSRAASGGIEDDVGERQSARCLIGAVEGQLVAHRFLALDAKGLLQCGKVEPAELIARFANQLAAVTDQAFHETDLRPATTASTTLALGVSSGISTKHDSPARAA